ncbi:hypothetical protein BN2475_590047 [Paraburkholderia ribeironis]|uniref:Uncharacterized protein n=1 Tax=Paraburkholderia ribeironis TaxID=1247936 RepID=A0A1N7SEH6_9BURK|nr:hypothetical protein BN2475_590047 [Paraburkholderia ribeironis]
MKLLAYPAYQAFSDMMLPMRHGTDDPLARRLARVRRHVTWPLDACGL